MLLKPYHKQWLSHADLTQQLVDRGLLVSDPTVVAAFLGHVNYYRFSGYCLAFEQPGLRHSFLAGTTFEQIRAAYDFDFALRDLVSEAIEVIEIDLRTTVAHEFGKKYRAFGYVESTNFYQRPVVRSKNPRPAFQHAVWLAKLREDVERSKERFVEHFRNTYLEAANHDLPIWALSEIMSFGSVSKMIDGMKSDDQRFIADRYRLSNSLLVSWCRHLTVARNICAHHGRLWDRYWSVSPGVPAIAAWQPPHFRSYQRLSMTLFVVYHILKSIPVIADWSQNWRTRVFEALTNLPACPITPSLGFTSDWFSSSIWC